MIILFNKYPYNFTKYSKKYIDKLISSSEYESIYLTYENSISKVNRYLYTKYLKDFNSSSNMFPLIIGQKCFNLLLAAISIDRISLKYPNEKIQIDLTKEELNINSRFVNFYGIIAERIGEPFKINIIKNTSNKKNFDKFDNSSKDLISKIFLYDFHLLKYYLKLHFSKLIPKKYLLSYGENLINREIKSELYKSNFHTYEIKKLVDNLYSEKIKPKYSNEEKKILIKQITQEFSKINSFFKNESTFNVFIEIVSDEILNSLSVLKFKKNKFRDLLSTININHKKTCLANGLFGLKGILLYDALKHNEYNVITSQHGLAPGISKHSNYSKFNESFTSDIFFCYNKSSIDIYKKNLDSKTIFHIVGAPKTSKKISNRIFNKFYLKKKMNLEGIQMVYLNDIVPFNSNKSFPTILPNSEIFNHNEEILIVLSKINQNFSFKDYPTEQFLFDHHSHLKSKFGDKIRFLKKDLDFRYIRPAFDLILTNATQSTLEWCIGASIPVVFLYDKNIMPLDSKEIETIFEKCFLFFDYNEEGWGQKLISFLNQPYKEILNKWKEKQKFRDQFDEEYFLSMNKNAGKIGANYILKYLDN
jgi:hypothetical protein